MPQLKKSLPKRCGNTVLKLRRETSWKRSQERKRARQAAADAAYRANLKLQVEGKLTPRENALAVAKTNRANKVLVDGPGLSEARGYTYNPAALVPDIKGNESTYERSQRERFWRALGRQVSKGVTNPKVGGKWSR